MSDPTRKDGPAGSEDFLSLLRESEQQAPDADFKSEMADIVPLSQDSLPAASELIPEHQAKIRQAAAVREPTEETDSAASGFVQMVEADAVLSYKTPGLQPNIMRRLRNGEYREIDFIDLHGKTLEQAYDYTMQFIAHARREEFRCIMIVHGKGEHGGQKALMKSYVAHRLRQIPDVLAFHSAPAWKGGTGSLIVLLKKGEKASATNRERHARR